MNGSKKMGKKVLICPSEQAVESNMLILFHDFLQKSRAGLPLVDLKRLGREIILENIDPNKIQDHKFNYYPLILSRKTSKSWQRRIWSDKYKSIHPS